jgi:SAM-dependent methyltransferase
VRVRTETGQDALMGTFPPGFFDRVEPGRPDQAGLDDPALAALRDLYDDLGIDGRVLGLCHGSPDHFNVPPDELLTAKLGDLPLPYADASFDDALCFEGLAAVTDPGAAFAEVARVLRPGGRFVTSFTSRRPAEAIRGWLATDDAGRVRIARRYFELTDGFGPAESDLRSQLTGTGDRLWAVWAARRARPAA